MNVSVSTSRCSTGINPPKPSNLRAVGAAKGPKEREARCSRSLPARRNPLQACTPAPRNVISVGLGFHRHFGDHLAGAKKVLLVEALNGWMVGRLDELDGEHVLVRVRHRHTANCLPTAVGTYSSSNG